jgi:ubiquinone/menaquinone biosynthesis C-methylase UbiE
MSSVLNFEGHKMARVLNSFEDLGRSVYNLYQNGCSTHWHHIKNWDLSQILNILKNYPKNARILEMGCGGSQLLRLFSEKGFVNCTGIDLTISRYDRSTQFHLMIHNHKRPYRLKKMDLTSTAFPDSYFDLVVTLSVIEHGVNLHNFLKESFRILKTGGILFLTTDYWEPKIDTGDLGWSIFSKKELKDFINLAKECGFSTDNVVIPPVSEPFIHYLGKDYTFASVTLIKS